MVSAPLIGIYGGTFNPIHAGHLRAAEEVMAQLGLERMIFVPSARPPTRTPRMAIPSHRRASGSPGRRQR